MVAITKETINLKLKYIFLKDGGGGGGLRWEGEMWTPEHSMLPLPFL